MEHIDLRAFDPSTAHHRLGAVVGAQVRAILDRKLGSLDPAELALQVRRVRGCQVALDRWLSDGGLDPAIGAALGEYAGCLAAWAEGAGLAGWAAEQGPRLVVDGARLSAVEAALWLQSEQNGCQTGVYRDDDGSVILWHTEEDVEESPGSRFDRLRLFSYRAAARDDAPVITSFVYPDLLPGPTFGWSSDLYVQAVDSLFVRLGDARQALLPNVLAWVRLYLGRAVTTERLVRALGPFLGGYALLAVQRGARGWEADRTEFAGDGWVSTALSHRPGEHLFQVNVLTDKTGPLALAHEEIRPERRRLFERRIERTARSIAVIRRMPDKIGCFQRLLASRAGGEFAYSNADVKATFLCHAAGQELRLWVGAGPGSREGQRWAVHPDATSPGPDGGPAI